MRIIHASQQTMAVDIVCSWCKTLIRVEQWANPTGIVHKNRLQSHGICLVCLDKETALTKGKRNANESKR